MSKSLEELSKMLGAYHDKNGFGFQFAIARVIKELHEGGRTRWAPLATEFPVKVPSRKGTRIDIVLSPFNNKRLLMVAECKRVDPARSDWCFFKNPFVHRNHIERYVAERTALVEGTKAIFASAISLKYFSSSPVFHAAVAMRSGEKGDCSGGGSDAIEDAVTQVLDGMNGMVEFFKLNPSLVDKSGLILLPVILTTAHLFSTSVDLSESDLKTGKIPPIDDMREEEFIYYQYHQSPGLRHTVGNDNASGILQAMVMSGIRTVVIVNTLFIEKFLAAMNPEVFDEASIK